MLRNQYVNKKSQEIYTRLGNFIAVQLLSRYNFFITLGSNTF